MSGRYTTANQKPKQRQRLPPSRGTDELERRILEMGFECKQKERWIAKAVRPDIKNPEPRWVYRHGSWRVLLPTEECPWRTVQWFCGDDCRWYVDFDLSVPVQCIISFMEL